MSDSQRENRLVEAWRQDPVYVTWVYILALLTTILFLFSCVVAYGIFAPTCEVAP